LGLLYCLGVPEACEVYRDFLRIALSGG
jgi:hypothetical protein